MYGLRYTGRSLIALLLGLVQAAPLADVPNDPVPTVITNVAVMDADGHVGPRRDVLLADGLIVGIEPVGSGWSDPDLTVVDGSHRTLMPGLIDVHVHVQSTLAVPGRVRIPHPRDNLRAMLYAGITTALDLSMERDTIDRLARKVDEGRIAGPHLYRSGMPYTAPGGHPLSSIRGVYGGFLVKWATRNAALTVQTADDVDDAVFRQGQTGFKKVMLDSIPNGAPQLSDAAALRLRVAATALGDRLIAHVGTPDDVDRALSLGVDALAHAPSHGRLSTEQARALATQGIPVIPTLVVWSSVADVHTGRLPALPFEDELLTRRQSRDLERSRRGQTPLPGAMGTWAESVVLAASERSANVRTLRDAGVTLLVGSDSPNMGTPAGSALHTELALLLDAGLERSAVLRAVTWDNSRFLDPDARFGAVRPGWEADLILVQGNPEDDLTALRRIVSVWTDGRLVERNPGPVYDR